MPEQVSAVPIGAFLEDVAASSSRNGAGALEAMTPLAVRVRGEYREMPGLRLTVHQAARLFSVAHDVADAVLQELLRASVLARSQDGAFSASSAESVGD